MRNNEYLGVNLVIAVVMVTMLGQGWRSDQSEEKIEEKGGTKEQ